MTIAELNDALRATFQGGRVVMTSGINSHPDRDQIIFDIHSYTGPWSEDNDPYGEHDFGKVCVNGVDCFWKIDYYNQDFSGLSENPADPDITQRVLTIMLAEEY